MGEIKAVGIDRERLAAPDRYGAPHARYRCSKLQFRVPRHSQSRTTLTQRRIGVDVDRPGAQGCTAAIGIRSGHCHDASARLRECSSGSRHSAT